ncbi:MAG TPA: Rrf2 family transcriptional regulator [Ruminococcus sp.]|jgi:Rrf2 family protein|nr:Rrf2 family transcriptional regulator [Ruminococcus sp.]
MKGLKNMKISSKVECGIIALVDICVNAPTENVVKVVSISQRQSISAKYLEQILPLLRHAGIIRSVKGAKGGYTLSRSASKITLAEIIDALDSSVLGQVSFEEKWDPLVTEALDDTLWSRMSALLRDHAHKISLSDLAGKYNGLVEDSISEPMYYI